MKVKKVLFSFYLVVIVSTAFIFNASANTDGTENFASLLNSNLSDDYWQGYDDGYNDGYDLGYVDSGTLIDTIYENGYEKGYSEGRVGEHDEGYEKGYDKGYEVGYEEGYCYAQEEDAVYKPAFFLALAIIVMIVGYKIYTSHQG